MTCLWKCSGCATAYEVGLPRCPECSSSDYEVIAVPTTTTGGASNAWEDQGPVAGAEAGPGVAVAGEVAGDVTVADVPPPPKPKRAPRQPKAKAAAKPVNTPADDTETEGADAAATPDAAADEPQLPTDTED